MESKVTGDSSGEGTPSAKRGRDCNLHVSVAVFHDDAERLPTPRETNSGNSASEVFTSTVESCAIVRQRTILGKYLVTCILACRPAIATLAFPDNAVAYSDCANSFHRILAGWLGEKVRGYFQPTHLTFCKACRDYDSDANLCECRRP